MPYRTPLGTLPPCRYDQNQAFFLYAMNQSDAGGDAPRGEPPLSEKLEWAGRMRARYTAAGSGAGATLLSTPNYRQWIGRGDAHCVVPYNRFWWETDAASGTTLSAWLLALTQGEPGSGEAAGADADCAGQAGDGACDVGLDRRPVAV